MLSICNYPQRCFRTYPYKFAAYLTPVIAKSCYQFAVIRNDVPANANGCCQITVFCSYAWRMVAINCGSPLLCFSEWVLSTCSFQQQCISKWLLSTCDLHIPCLSKWVLAICSYPQQCNNELLLSTCIPPLPGILASFMYFVSWSCPVV